MNHRLVFEKLVHYDAGKPGISIDVELRLGDGATSVNAKIDTGSTYCVFERSHGESLGIEIEDGLPQKIQTANGSFQAFAHQITRVFEDYEFDSTIYFAESANFNRNILGRHGWLDRVIVGINDYDGKLYLSRYESE